MNIELTGLEVDTLRGWLGSLVESDELDSGDRYVFEGIYEKLGY
jgi:hypothetical protein